MPAPSAILGEGWEWRYRFIGHTWVTLYETLGGFALSIVVGVPLAVLIVYSPALQQRAVPADRAHAVGAQDRHRAGAAAGRSATASSPR